MAQCCAFRPDGTRCENKAVHEGRYDCCDECMERWKEEGSIRFFMKPEVREETGYPFETLVCKYVPPSESEEEKPKAEGAEEEKQAPVDQKPIEEGPEKEGPEPEGFKPTKDLCVTLLAESVDGVKEKCKEFQSILQDQPGAYVALLRTLYRTEGKEGRKSLREWLKEEGSKITKKQKVVTEAAKEAEVAEEVAEEEALEEREGKKDEEGEGDEEDEEVLDDEEEGDEALDEAFEEALDDEDEKDEDEKEEEDVVEEEE